MKRQKIFYYVIVSFVILGFATGCTLKKESPSKNQKKEEILEEKEKGNCSLVECMKQLEIHHSLEDINRIIGFSGKQVSENSNKYVWQFTDSTKIEFTAGSNGGSISATIDRNKIKNEKVDFSRYSEIKELLNSGTSLTYDEFKEKVGGVEGTIVSKSPLSKRYMWVNEKGGYLSASFSERSQKCTIVSGRY